MKSPVLTILFFCAAYHAFSQGPDAGQQFIRKKCGTLHVHLPLGQNGQQYRVLFDSIRVVDLRRDTSRIGLIGAGRWAQDEVLFSRPVAEQVAAYLNAGYSRPQGSRHLLVVVKDLWISDESMYQGSLHKSVWDVAFRFEAYVQAEKGYIPLTYLDTLDPAAGFKPEDIAAHHLPGLIAIFMDKVAEHVIKDDLSAKRVVSFGQIDSFSRARFSYPMDTATSLVRGVYADAREFRYNAPSRPAYEISKDKSGDIELRIPDENGQFYYTHTVWGFCDGKQVYVMMDGNVFPVFSVFHQWYVLGSKDYQDKQLWIPLILPLGAGGFIGSATDINNNVVRTLRLFRLDEQSGKVTE